MSGSGGGLLSAAILIVGAGIAGLSLARHLKKFDLEFEIIERNPSEAVSRAGVILPFTAVRELRQLGVFNELAGKYHPLSEIGIKTVHGHAIGRTALAKPPFNNDLAVSLKRQDLWNALFTGMEKKVRFNTELRALTHEDDCVEIECSNELLNGKYDLVIAADGLNSTVRRLNFEGQQILSDHHLQGWRFLLSFPNHGLEATYMIGSNTDMFAYFPINEDLIHCYAHVHESAELYNSMESTSHNISRIFSAYATPVPEILSRLEGVKMISGRIKSMEQAQFFDRRIAFAGDASSGSAAFLQQGIATALEDSRYLADSLAMQHIDGALETYREKRQIKIDWLHRDADSCARYFETVPGPVGRLMRNMQIRFLGLPPVRIWKKAALAHSL
ncbi:MAG: FAD-dependent monooxygenase [Alphaproteobacteria bacterium]|nr:MAG: FAD-dependent monooxygenase [Alphaproteobacteria bacterium]